MYSGILNRYTLEEDMKILRYILAGRHKKSIELGPIWQKMEKEKVCFPRSWRSMRQRFQTIIKPNINDPKYELTENEKLYFGKIRPTLNKPLRAASTNISSSQQAANNIFFQYDVVEDKAIFKYILDRKYESLVKGNELWRKMQYANVCPNRSWQDLRKRFLKYLVVNCSDPKYELSRDEQMRLKSAFFNKVKKRKLLISTGSTEEDDPPHLQQVDTTPPVIIDTNKAKTSHSSAVNIECQPIIYLNRVNEMPRLARTQEDEKKSVDDVIVISSTNKEFYSLDVEWSDSD